MADEVFEVNLQSLKIREIEEIEDALGAGVDAAFAEGQPRGKALRVVAWVLKKRADPDFTLEQAGELVIQFDGGGPDPTNATGS